MNKWTSKQISNFRSLEGKELDFAFIREMALYEKDDGNQEFVRDDCPFVQANVILLHLNSGAVFEMFTVQNYDSWDISGKYIDPPEGEHPEFEEGSIFRYREESEFPKGMIQTVDVRLNEADEISEVELAVNDKRILLKSGEVYEKGEGKIDILEMDESILIFHDPSLLEKVGFK